MKFYIDGDDKFPTYCGTGTEDYFLSSYGFATTYSTPFAGVTLKENVRNNSPDGNSGRSGACIAGTSWIRFIFRKT